MARNPSSDLSRVLTISVITVARVKSLEKKNFGMKASVIWFASDETTKSRRSGEMGMGGLGWVRKKDEHISISSPTQIALSHERVPVCRSPCLARVSHFIADPPNRGLNRLVSTVFHWYSFCIHCIRRSINVAFGYGHGAFWLTSNLILKEFPSMKNRIKAKQTKIKFRQN